MFSTVFTRIICFKVEFAEKPQAQFLTVSGSTVIRQLVLNDVEEGCSSTLHKVERKVSLEHFRPQRHAFSTVSITGVLLLFFNGQQHTQIYLKAIGQHLEAKMHKQEKRVLIFLFFEKSR